MVWFFQKTKFVIVLDPDTISALTQHLLCGWICLKMIYSWSYETRVYSVNMLANL